MNDIEGPWAIFTIASPAGVSYRIFKPGKKDEDIAHIPMEWSGNGSRAILIASAPRLLAVLKAIEMETREGGQWTRAEINEAAQNAISEATLP